MIHFKKRQYANTLNFGDIEFIDVGAEGTLVYRRKANDQSVLIVVNLTNEKKAVTIDQTVNSILFKNNPDMTLNGNHIICDPFAAAVLGEEIM